MGSGSLPHDVAFESAAPASHHASEQGREVERSSLLYEGVAGIVSEAYGTVREKVPAEAVAEVSRRQKEQIAAAIEAGKQAYREEKRKAGVAGEGEDS